MLANSHKIQVKYKFLLNFYLAFCFPGYFNFHALQGGKEIYSIKRHTIIVMSQNHRALDTIALGCLSYKNDKIE